VATLIFEGGSWDGLPGHVVVRAYGGSASASISVPFAGVSAHHIIEIVVLSTPGNQVEVWADLKGGLHLVWFYSITLARELVFDAGTFCGCAHRRSDWDGRPAEDDLNEGCDAAF
jgi:hypothetical protein